MFLIGIQPTPLKGGGGNIILLGLVFKLHKCTVCSKHQNWPGKLAPPRNGALGGGLPHDTYVDWCIWKKWKYFLILKLFSTSQMNYDREIKLFLFHIKYKSSIMYVGEL